VSSASPVLEKEIENNVVRWWRRKHYLTIKVMKVKGWPDRLFIGPGPTYVWIEFKTPTGRVSKIQEYTIRIMRALNCRVYVMDNHEEAKEVLLWELINQSSGSRKATKKQG